MKLLVVHPGASWSTSDVWSGLCRGLTDAGHEVVGYRLDGRMDAARRHLLSDWRHAGRPEPGPTDADVLYYASWPIIERALALMPDWVVIC